MKAFFDRNRQDRLDFIQSHFYTAIEQKFPETQPPFPRFRKRRKLIKKYTDLFNMDNVYEHDVFREMIARINDCFDYKVPVVTLGHWIPLAKGGKHCCKNWIIQIRIDNEQQADEIPDCEKLTWQEQIDYISELLKLCPKPEKVKHVTDFLKTFQEVYDESPV